MPRMRQKEVVLVAEKKGRLGMAMAPGLLLIFHRWST